MHRPSPSLYLSLNTNQLAKRNSSGNQNFQLTILKRKHKRPIKISRCVHMCSSFWNSSWTQWDCNLHKELQRNKIVEISLYYLPVFLYLQFRKQILSWHAALVLYFPSSFRLDRKRKIFKQIFNSFVAVVARRAAISTGSQPRSCVYLEDRNVRTSNLTRPCATFGATCTK